MDDLLEKTTGDVSVGDVVNTSERRGFGPLLLLPTLVALPPTGAMPGVPSISGVTLCIKCLQMAFSENHPWLPGILKNRSLSHVKRESAVKKSRPYVVKAEKILTPRLRHF